MLYGEFTNSIATLSDAHDVGTLYRKEITNGQLVSKTGIDLIGALIGHIFKWIIGQTKSENDQLMKELFDDAKAYFTVDESSDSPAINASTEITPYALKVSKYVLEQLKSKKLIEDKEFTAIDEELKTHIKEIPDELKELVEDSDWKEIPSIYEVLKLSDELKKRSPKLSESQVVLMQRCLHLNEKIIHARELIKDNPEYTDFFNIEEFNAIQEVPARLAKASVRIHKRFHLHHGEVEVVDGKLNPTKKQLLAAFKLAKQIPIVNHSNDPQLMKISARLIQTILLGPEGIKEIPFPQDCHSFEYQELNTQAENSRIPIKFEQLSSYLEYHIRSQTIPSTEAILIDIKSKTGISIILLEEDQKNITEKCFIQEASDSSLSILKELLTTTTSSESENTKTQLDKYFQKVDLDKLQNLKEKYTISVSLPLEKDRIKEIVEENLVDEITADNVDSLKAALQTAILERISKKEKAVTDFIENITVDDLSKYQKKAQEKSIPKYAGNFIKDSLDRGNPLQINEISYNLTNPEERDQFFSVCRDEYYKSLLSPNGVTQAMDQLELLHETCQFPKSMTQDQFYNFLVDARSEGTQVTDEALKAVAEKTCFSDEQIEILTKHSGKTKEEIEPLLRLKMLQLMLVCNQSAQGANTSNFNPEIKKQIETRLHLNSKVSCTQKETMTTVSPSLDSFEAYARYHMVIIKDGSGLDYSENLVPIGSFDKVLTVDALSPPSDGSHTFGTYSEYNHVGISPLAVLNLEDLTKAITEQKISE